MGKVKRSKGYVKRGNVRKRKVKKNPVPVDPVIRQYWNPTVSAKQNYDNLGIRSEPTREVTQPFKVEAFTHLV